MVTQRRGDMRTCGHGDTGTLGSHGHRDVGTWGCHGCCPSLLPTQLHTRSHAEALFGGGGDFGAVLWISTAQWGGVRGIKVLALAVLQQNKAADGSSSA